MVVVVQALLVMLFLWLLNLIKDMCYNKHINKIKGFLMTVAKLTTTIPFELKERLVSLKDELHVSMSTIYKEALEQYLETKEIERWEKGAKLASENKEYMQLCKTLGNEGAKIYEY
jgi:predicted DNA-binding protein